MSVMEQIEQYFVEERGMTPEQVPAGDASLFEAGLLDSLAMVEFISFLEESFGITLTEDDVVPDNFATLDAVAAMVDGKQG